MSVHCYGIWIWRLGSLYKIYIHWLGIVFIIIQWVDFWDSKNYNVGCKDDIWCLLTRNNFEHLGSRILDQVDVSRLM